MLQAGEVKDLRLVKNYAGKSKGYGYVELASIVSL